MTLEDVARERRYRWGPYMGKAELFIASGGWAIDLEDGLWRHPELRPPTAEELDAAFFLQSEFGRNGRFQLGERPRAQVFACGGSER